MGGDSRIQAKEDIQDVPGGKVNILGGHSIGHSKQKSVYVHVFYSVRFPRQSYFTVQHKKGDKTDCSDYRGISLPSTFYPIFFSQG
jgi:hypothetical protein